MAGVNSVSSGSFHEQGFDALYELSNRMNGASNIQQSQKSNESRRSSSSANPLGSKIFRFFETLSHSFKNWKKAPNESTREELNKTAVSGILDGLKKCELKGVYQGFKQLYNAVALYEPDMLQDPDTLHDKVSHLLLQASAKIPSKDFEKICLNRNEFNWVDVEKYSDGKTLFYRVMEKLQNIGLTFFGIEAKLEKIKSTDNFIKIFLDKRIEKFFHKQEIRNMMDGIINCDEIESENPEYIYNNMCEGELRARLKFSDIQCKGIESGPFVNVATNNNKNVAINKKAFDEWPNCQIHFDDGKGNCNFTKKSCDTQEAIKKLKESAAFVHNFTGSDEATKVLSTVLTEEVWREIATKTKNINNEQIEFELASEDEECTIINGFDSEEEKTTMTVNNQFANARIYVSKSENGDYKIAIDWELTAIGIKRHGGDVVFFGGRKPAKGQVTEALLIRLECDVNISAQHAQNGELYFLPISLQHTLSGKISCLDPDRYKPDEKPGHGLDFVYRGSESDISDNDWETDRSDDDWEPTVSDEKFDYRPDLVYRDLESDISDNDSESDIFGDDSESIDESERNSNYSVFDHI